MAMRRVFHHWETWECVKAGMYASDAGHDPESATRLYAEFLRDIPRFERAMERVVKEWPISCEQFLSNDSINRIAWLGQSAMCIDTGIPRNFRAGFKLLSDSEQEAANAAAARMLSAWIADYKRTTTRQRMLEFAI